MCKALARAFVYVCMCVCVSVCVQFYLFVHIFDMHNTVFGGCRPGGFSVLQCVRIMAVRNIGSFGKKEKKEMGRKKSTVITILTHCHVWFGGNTPRRRPMGSFLLCNVFLKKKKKKRPINQRTNQTQNTWSFFFTCQTKIRFSILYLVPASSLSTQINNVCYFNHDVNRLVKLLLIGSTKSAGTFELV